MNPFYLIAITADDGITLMHTPTVNIARNMKKLREEKVEKVTRCKFERKSVSLNMVRGGMVEITSYDCGLNSQTEIPIPPVTYLIRQLINRPFNISIDSGI